MFLHFRTRKTAAFCSAVNARAEEPSECVWCLLSPFMAGCDCALGGAGERVGCCQAAVVDDCVATAEILPERGCGCSRSPEDPQRWLRSVVEV